MTKAITGVVPILLTPFDRHGRIDEDSLKNLIDFNIGAGVHGLGVALGSEVFKFNETEREQVIGTTINAVNKRVPVVINTGAAGTDLAVYYSRAAEDAGADALMVIPPSFMPASADEIVDYYVQISNAVSIPIFMQDVPQGPISPGLAMRIADSAEHANHIKVETLPVTNKVIDMVRTAGNRLTILGGAGGSYFIEEMRRGSRGTMPFCSQPQDFVKVWDLFQAGDEKQARAVFDSRIMAINRLAVQGGDLFYHVHKQFLVRLGIIETAHVRSPTQPIDATSQREIDELLELLTG